MLGSVGCVLSVFVMMVFIFVSVLFCSVRCGGCVIVLLWLISFLYSLMYCMRLGCVLRCSSGMN